jgi:hypothetical protein
VVWPHPYFERASSRPGVRELTRVWRKPCAASHSLTATPPPTSAWIQRLATLSLTVSIRNASSRSGSVSPGAMYATTSVLSTYL